jgi:hypothetical protein
VFSTDFELRGGGSTGSFTLKNFFKKIKNFVEKLIFLEKQFFGEKNGGKI